jgi:2-oxo-4-hydroxy-4-carboxy-5-ureidoimidazoline decarboxylase
MPYSLSELNQLSQVAFTEALGSVFEHTPSIAERVWHDRPFTTVLALHQQMVTAMHTLTSDQQLALIRAHPDLGSKAKMAPDSVAEQAGAGLDQLSEEEFTRFCTLNRQYQSQFGFPFIIAVKNHTKASILAAFITRLTHTQAQEQAQALLEIAEIARFRLLSYIQPEHPSLP